MRFSSTNSHSRGLTSVLQLILSNYSWGSVNLSMTGSRQIRFINYLLASTLLLTVVLGAEDEREYRSCKDNCINNAAEHFAKNENATNLVYNNLTATLTADILAWPNPNGIDRYEVSLLAASNQFVLSPLTCDNDHFLTHTITNLDICESGPNPKAMCVSKKDTNFTLEFHFVYTGVYCLMVTPFSGTNSRRPHQKIIYLQTAMVPEVEIHKWNTTIDLQPIPQQKSIHVSFTNPHSEYHIEAFQVSLLKGNGEVCERESAWIEEVSVSPHQKNVHVEFTNKSEGYYCAVVIPIDFRCEGDNIWTVKGSCARYSIAKYLKACPLTNESHGIDWEILYPHSIKQSMELWIIWIILAASIVIIAVLAVGLVSLKKNKLLCYISTVKHFSIDTSDREPDETGTVEMVPEVLFLYCRDSVDIRQRVRDLRKKLQTEHKFTVYDYGDQLQWDQMSQEGIEWLPNRINRNNIRVVVIYSKEALQCQRFFVGPKKNVDRPQERYSPGGEKTQLLSEYGAAVDRDFVYGMQLLVGSFATRQCTYQRVFNVRFSEADQSEDIFALMTPFTSFLLPLHYSQLVEHLKG